LQSAHKKTGLLEFANASVSKDITLVIKVESEEGSEAYFKGRPTNGYDNSTLYLDSFKVYIDSFNLTSNCAEVKEGKIWAYSLTLVETR
jgi:hypothetical protein